MEAKDGILTIEDLLVEFESSAGDRRTSDFYSDPVIAATDRTTELFKLLLSSEPTGLELVRGVTAARSTQDPNVIFLRAQPADRAELIAASPHTVVPFPGGTGSQDAGPAGFTAWMLDARGRDGCYAELRVGDEELSVEGLPGLLRRLLIPPSGMIAVPHDLPFDRVQDSWPLRQYQRTVEAASDAFTVVAAAGTLARLWEPHSSISLEDLATTAPPSIAASIVHWFANLSNPTLRHLAIRAVERARRLLHDMPRLELLREEGATPALVKAALRWIYTRDDLQSVAFCFARAFSGTPAAGRVQEELDRLDREVVARHGALLDHISETIEDEDDDRLFFIWTRDETAWWGLYRSGLPVPEFDEAPAAADEVGGTG